LDFKLYRGSLIVVRGSVGKHKNLRFMVDTGTNRSIADRRLIEMLGAVERPGSIGVLGQQVGAKESVLNDVNVGPVAAEYLPVSVLDLRFIEQALNARIDMLVGLDVLGKRDFSVDYESKRLVFGRVAALSLAVPMESGPPLVSVLAQMNGVSYRLLVNTAASRLTLFSTDKPGFSRQIKIGNTDLAINVAGNEVVCELARLGPLRLGEKEISPGAVCLVNDQRGQFDGSLPIRALGFKEVAFDFERHVLWLR
jgi:hypothetical protein